MTFLKPFGICGLTTLQSVVKIHENKTSKVVETKTDKKSENSTHERGKHINFEV